MPLEGVGVALGQAGHVVAYRASPEGYLIYIGFTKKNTRYMMGYYKKYSKFKVHVCLRRSRRTRLFVWAGSPALHEQCNGNATQAIAQNHALESRPPARHSEKKIAVARWQSA